MGLHSSQIRQISRGHLLNAAEFLAPIESARFKSEYWLLGPQTAREVSVPPKHSTARPMNQEERWARPSCLNLHQRSPSRAAVFLGFFPDHCGQLLNRRL